MAEPEPDEDGLLTTEQVIRRLLADPELRRFVASCVLPAVRSGADWKFRAADLERWIARQGGRQR
jgi:hypothetical protein